MSAEEIGELVAGDGDLTARLLNDLALRLSPENFPGVARGLQAPQPFRRLIAMVSTVIDLCNGADTERGLGLALSLTRFLEDSWERFAGDHDKVRTCCAHAVNALSYARYQEGTWADLLAWIPLVAVSFPGIEAEPLYWNAVATAARALLGQNQAARARALLQSIREGFEADAPQIDLARRALREFETQRFEVDRRPSIGEQAQAIWRGTIFEQVKAVQGLRESFLRMGLSETRRQELERIVAVTEEMRDLALEDAPFERKMSRLAPIADRWYDDLTRFSYPNAAIDHVNLAWIERRAHTTSMLVASESPDNALAGRVLRDLDRADVWRARAGDIQGSWQNSWQRILLKERLRAADRSAELGALCARLNATRRATDDDETRSNVANVYAGLPAKICRDFDESGNVGLVVEGCELRKGRALLAARADAVAANALDVAGGRASPDMLGKRTHYLGYTALHGDDRIQAVLYTCDGTVSSARIDLPVSVVRHRVSQRQLDPTNWRARISALPLRALLAPLVAPLRDALGSGRVGPGDHLCIAADDPVHLVPLQYLLIGDRLAVELVSMSRCSSFSDARAIAGASADRPASVTAVFMPTVSTRLTDERGAFERIASSLASTVESSHSVATAAITATGLLDLLTPRSVIHLDGHGTFPDGVDPYRESGLVVSDGRTMPVRGSANQRLLTPAEVVEGTSDLRSSHVTLNACVSGRGLEGKGGDILGHEQALRLRGASSVIASHWDVPMAVAETFMLGFYRRWLGEGAGRASAWRDTILDMMGRADSSERAAECCVFSLFGEWR